MVAAQDKRNRPLPHSGGDERRDASAGLEDLGQVAGSLVRDDRSLRMCRLDVAAVVDLEADRAKPLLEPRVSDRRRPHIDPATALAEVERGTDYSDSAAHHESPRSTAQTLCDGFRKHIGFGSAAAGRLAGRGEVAQLVEHTAE